MAAILLPAQVGLALSPREGNLVPDKTTAVAIAEPILFARYGKQAIEQERPYHIVEKDGCWIIDGHFIESVPPPNLFVGGVFHIVIDKRNACVREISHGE